MNWVRLNLYLTGGITLLSMIAFYMAIGHLLYMVSPTHAILITGLYIINRFAQSAFKENAIERVKQLIQSGEATLDDFKEKE